MPFRSQNNSSTDGRSGVWFSIVAIIGLCVAAAVYALVSVPNDSPLPTATSTDEVRENWIRYHNEDYNFSIRHPESWKIRETVSRAGTPFINIVPQTNTATEPIDHFVNTTHVSVYPEGIPTEGVIGQTAELTVAMQPAVAQGRTYLLESQQPFGYYITFETSPVTWEPYGYVWGRIEVNDYTVRCHVGENVVSASSPECQPLMGDSLIHSGTVSEQDAATVRTILESFRFMNTASSG